LDQQAEANQLFSQMCDWAEQASGDVVTADFFAVSLPDLLVLNGDRQLQHKEHLLLVKGLAELGAGDNGAAASSLQQALALNPANNKAQLFLRLAEQQEGLLNAV